MNLILARIKDIARLHIEQDPLRKRSWQDILSRAHPKDEASSGTYLNAVKGVGEKFSSQAINLRSGPISGLAEKIVSSNAILRSKKWALCVGVWGHPPNPVSELRAYPALSLVRGYPASFACEADPVRCVLFDGV